ncbi:ABC transporter permease [Streptomyces sp. MI02-7b]|uniref:ABC transporter permease n=1 Tax=Streptomyces sp. MI02-7b TaxID=462941 RepID=UPI0029BABB25|nr:ABC transporter permease [Streptomyces sp. MI02-7b]MDX3078367.1 ABC transporter permease [Streptomyces sp. MI02-7b]
MITTNRPTGPVRAVEILLAGARMQVLLVRSHPLIPVVTVVQPVVFFLVVTARHPATADRADLLFAVLLTSLWGGTLWTAGGILRRDMADGTLGRNLVSASDPRLVVIGKCLGSCLLVLALLACTGGTIAVVTGIHVPLAALPWLVAGLVFVALSGTALGYLLSALFVLVRHPVQLTSALVFPVYILGGLLIPTSALPAPLAALARGISLYWAQRLLSSAVSGDGATLPALLVLGALTIAYFLVGNVFFVRVVHRARVKGTIDLG